MALRIYTRAEWGARYANGAVDSDGRPILLPLPWAENWAHHTAGGYLPPTATFEQECAEMRRIEQTGQDRFGQGISYTFVIFPSGRVYEGHSIDRRGAHTAGRNDIARAYCYPGNYSTHQLTIWQESSTAAVLQHANDAGWCARRTLNGGHRDLKATACPGDHAYAQIPEINRRAAAPTQEDTTMSAAVDNAAANLTTAIGEYLLGAEGMRNDGAMALLIKQGADAQTAAAEALQGIETKLGELVAVLRTTKGLT